jgi:hypothetical protein
MGVLMLRVSVAAAPGTGVGSAISPSHALAHVASTRLSGKSVLSAEC